MSDHTPTQRIEAAIVRLEELKEESTPGPWGHFRDSESDLGFGPIMESLVVAEADDYVLDWGSGVREPDATLICTLHATIDPILALLRAALVEHSDVMTSIEKPYWVAALALVDAIISGGTE